MPPKPKVIPNPTLFDVPPGYARGAGIDGEDYIVPHYLLPDLHQALDSYRKKRDLGLVLAQPSFNKFDEDLETDSVGEALVVYPANPVLSDQERLSVHSEILALQERLGISYKDASHRLYMAEVAKLKAVDKQCKGLANLSACIEESLQKLETVNMPITDANTNTEKGKGNM